MLLRSEIHGFKLGCWRRSRYTGMLLYVKGVIVRLNTVLVFKVKFADNIVDKLLLYWVNNEKSK